MTSAVTQTPSSFVHYPPPPCANGKCDFCGHVHCGVTWCQDGSARSGGDWSVVCAGVNKCHDKPCEFCKFLVSGSPYAPISTRVCCNCGKNHPKVNNPDASSSSEVAKYLPEENNRKDQAYFIEMHNAIPARERDFEENKRCLAPQGCTNYGSKTTLRGLRVCNACFLSLDGNK